MRGSKTERAENFEQRLKETFNSELDPELVTPMSAAIEEAPEKEEVIPLAKQFRQSNMGGRRTARSTTTQRGRDQQ